MLQKVIDYEFNVVQQKVVSDYPVSRPGNSFPRYGVWKLNEKIQKIPQSYDYDLLWIGNDRSAHITALFYCVLLGSLQGSQKKDEAFLKVKFYLYQLCQEYLSIEEQKVFVENICLLPYSKSLTEFLKKNQAFEDVVIKLFNKYKRENSMVLIQAEFEPMQQIKLFAKMFQFVSLEAIEQKMVRIAIKNFYFYIIQECQCYFVLQEKNMSPVKKILTQSNQELIFQTYRKRSSKKRKLGNSPTSPKAAQSPKYKIGSSNQNYSTPKFYFNSSNQQLNFRSSKDIKVGVFKEQSSESQGRQKRQDSLNQQNSHIKYVTLKTPQSVSSPKSRQNLLSLASSNIKNKIISKGQENQLPHNTTFPDEKRRISKENHQNPEKFVQKRNKIIVQSLGANDKDFRNSIPFIGDLQKEREKRSVPKFILEKQKNSRKMSPKNTMNRVMANKNIVKPRISSKVYVNSNILASPIQNQYLFTYHPK